MVVCVGNCTKTHVLLTQQRGLIEVFNSKEKNIQRKKITEPKEINEILPYFQKIQTFVKEPIDYFCFRQHNDFDNKFRKEIVQEAKRFGIKNFFLIGETKALLFDALSLFRYNLQHDDVFWIITYKLEYINCYIWKYDEKNGWKFEEHQYQKNSGYQRNNVSDKVVIMKEDLEVLKAKIAENEVLPFLFVFCLHDLPPPCEETFKKVLPCKNLLVLHKNTKLNFLTLNSSLNYAKYLSGAYEYTHYKSKEILEKSIEVKMNDKIIIQANQNQVLPLNESYSDRNSDCNILQIYENQKYVSSIPLPSQGNLGLHLMWTITHFSSNDKCNIANNILAPLKTPQNIILDDDGVQKTDGILNFEVIKIDSAAFSALFDENEIYRNFTSPKGLALIINNKKFNSHSERHGTEIDETNIKNLFSQLGYKIKYIYHDLSGKNMIKAAQDFANDEVHKVYDSCVVVILTHGKYDILLGVDGEHVNVHDFLGCFNSKNAPLLKGKPKLFFLQACRGAKFDSGVDATDFLFPCLKTKLKNEETYQQTPTSIDGPRHPVESDMLIAFATPSNYVSWRNIENGSWFIQSICEVFSKHSAKEDICSLLTKVNRRVADVFSTSKRGQTCKQVPEYVSRLQKRFYFFPGIQN